MSVQPTIQHVVLFRFPESFGETGAAELRSKVSRWPAEIGGFRQLRLGADLNDGQRARGYQFLLYTEHDGVDGLRAYQQHPVHLAFADWVRERGGEVLAFDYELTADTVIFDAAAPNGATR